MTIESLLVANRGEIAIRILRAAADAGIRGVAIHSTDDDGALHVQRADEARALGAPSTSRARSNHVASPLVRFSNPMMTHAQAKMCSVKLSSCLTALEPLRLKCYGLRHPPTHYCGYMT